ncbi:AAA family ATPase [Brachybacterium alimentarium]|uniref:AAA family ATPase n=1 Tax=Brachybacterium alimentarium TaxID=47845 RepID=UPI003FD47F6E
MSDSEPNTPIDWATFLSSSPPEPDWLVFPLVERGQQACLYSETKAGKSLLALDLLKRACMGVQLDDSKTAPIRVLYLDFENPEDDLRLRLDSFQASAEDLEGLVYIQFPILPPFDTEEGGEALLSLVMKHQVDLVVIDTISRAIEGLENESSTWHRFYRYTLLGLKRLRVASLRLDHSGKALSSGARGSSAKNSDVDAVWSLKHEKSKRRRTLKRTYTRRGRGPDQVALDEQTRPLLHVLAGVRGGDLDEVEALCVQLDRLGILPDAGRPTVSKVLREQGVEASTKTLEEVVRRRKDRSRDS